MPIYGYRCRSCGHEFEILQKMSDTPLKTCPKCSGQLAKIPYAAGVIFKGSGFYTTDYKGRKAAEGASSNGAAKSSAGDESKAAKESRSESKPESKSESKATESSSSE